MLYKNRFSERSLVVIVTVAPPSRKFDEYCSTTNFFILKLYYLI